MKLIKFHKPILFLWCYLFIAGCATALTPISTYVPSVSKHRVGKEPGLGIVTQVQVGEAIYTEFDYVEVEQEEARIFEGARLINGYTESFALGRISIEPGDLLLGYKDTGGSRQYCTTSTKYYDLLVGPYDIVCFSDESDDGNLDRVRVPRIMLGSWKSKVFVPYKKEDIKEMTGSFKDRRYENGFKFELIYQGASNGTMKIAYREYIDNFARPAFYQEVNYVLNSTDVTTINFKGVEIDVINANNNGITYRTRKGFRSK